MILVVMSPWKTQAVPVTTCMNSGCNSCQSSLEVHVEWAEALW
jgi:hypothetical protein